MVSDKELATQQNSGQVAISEATTLTTSANNQAAHKTPFLVGFPIFVLVVALLIYAGFGAYQWLQDEQRLPVQDIVISGELLMLDTTRLQRVVRNQAKGSFFALDVDHVHKLMEEQAWVYTASVRKRWPSKLYIHIVEQKAVAKWNDDLLLNRYGDTFEGLSAKQRNKKENQELSLSEVQSAEMQKLPQLFGPMGSEKTALTGYTHMQRLLNTSGQKIALLSLSERFAWQAKLSNHVLLKLGRQEYINRLQRYIDVYPLLQQQEKSVAYVDLRYDTGLAVGWSELRASDKQGDEFSLEAANKNNS
ncbi:MAG: cell division protein FtsQ [Alphaproteobacteria bacterium]|jgi:cell division protein FtsQ